ncbi:DNA mismatch repair protein MutS [Kiritimatiella glycovorans]|uniref:DNA mismatch repair protein MutS n=1 Tax=Kiritimatiella glycovorans TaxID=1307763 RepID=A0A0G3EIP1_9BACT|nr:DNA mismatch repair protein MutS [Kiritimatiella glycovorans]AKJ64019.1 DNA mismatch repair protein MutS [Kiritimatiella glycovorans]
MAKKQTPMMEQYRAIRRGLGADTILFFRLGDFYEMFFDDAREAAGILDIALTRRNGIPMCGVPYHACENYVSKLIRAGKKVAVCDQVEEPSQGRKVVAREITGIITPGTVLEESALESKRNNYLAALIGDKGRFGLALLDLSTGDFRVEESEDAAAVRENLLRYDPAECVIPESDHEKGRFSDWLSGDGAPALTPHEDWTFEEDSAQEFLTRHFRTRGLEGFGCADQPLGLRAAGAVLHYVGDQLQRDLSHVTRLRAHHPGDYLLLDETTVANLELVAAAGSARSGTGPTLLKVLDTTRTAMGARLLRHWILRPLRRADAIERRLDAIEAFRADRNRLDAFREHLREVKDVERLAARLHSGTGSPRDVRALACSLERIPELRALLDDIGCAPLEHLRDELCDLPELRRHIQRAIVDEPPALLKDGGVIREGYHAELDELRDAAGEGKQWLADFQAREQQRTGIRTLKVRHNKVFGYYIEVTKSNLEHVPDEYVRKQTLVNAERYITPELKEYENRIFGAQERSLALEQELFAELRRQVLEHTAELQSTAAAVAGLDALATLAERSLLLGYVRPEISETDVLRIHNGRHPVIEQMPGAERFVPNDTELNQSSDRLLIITGPNMAGKSTYIRQVALITIMAHLGSFVPAERAVVGLTDRVFTRIGASDDLAGGRSTFMVEMQETANILNNATERSLIVLDEIGRGTSTFDGISIAWAVAEHLCRSEPSGARTLFATHYHELTDLARTVPGVRNYNVRVRESGERITFLRKIAPGPADKSYGIQVARLAGLPPEVIRRASEILENLEEGEFAESGQPRLARHRPKSKREHDHQIPLF